MNLMKLKLSDNGIIINEDGTMFNPPKSESSKALTEKYPACEYGFTYKCMYCGDCPYGDHFLANHPEATEMVLEDQKELEDYVLAHNPSFNKGE